MTKESARDYHTRRARSELDLAYRAAGFRATEAHLRLYALHLAELRTCPAAPAASLMQAVG